MSNFTPGPWFIKYADDISFMSMTVITNKDLGQSNIGRLTDDEENHVVAIVYHQSYPGVGLSGKNDANAKLIAAAPDLYAVVKELQESAGYWSEWDVPLGIVERINEVLKKVDGVARQQLAELQAKLEPLSDDEIRDCAESENIPYFESKEELDAFARAIEAAHGITGEYK